MGEKHETALTGTVVLSDVYVTCEVRGGQEICGAHGCLPTLSMPSVLGGLPQKAGVGAEASGFSLYRLPAPAL